MNSARGFWAPRGTILTSAQSVLCGCERVAIVTDIGWVRLTVKALRFLIPSEIRVFATVQADEGRAWIRARPGSRTGPEVAAPVRTRRARTRRVRRSSPPLASSLLAREQGQTAA